MPLTREDKLVAHTVLYPWQVEIMRQIYNATLPWLEQSGRPLPHRAEVDQQNWWFDSEIPMTAHIYTTVDEPWKFIAFSLIQFKEDRFSTPLFGILPEAHGNGYGEVILRHYLEIAGGPLAGSDRIDNPAITKLNDRNGWKVIGITDGVRKLFHPGVEPTEDEMQHAYDEICRYHGYGEKE